MIITELPKLPVIAGRPEQKDAGWMFKKAQELGFTDAEIGCLRAIYDRRAVPEGNSSSIKMGD